MGGPSQFERPRSSGGRSDLISGGRPELPVAALAALTSEPVAGDRERHLEVPGPIADLLPRGGPRRGTTLGVTGSAGASSLALALVSTASQAGRWVAVVGAPSIGPVAAHGYGVALERLVLVPDPGPQWAVVTAALLESMDVVMVHPPARVRPADARRLAARTRERGAVLLLLAATWVGTPDLDLSVVRAEWEGLAAGHGHLRARRAEVVVTGRRAGGPRRTGWLWLPGVDGRVATAPAPTATPRPVRVPDEAAPDLAPVVELAG